MKRPNSMRHLDDAIRRLCGGAPQDFVRARTVMANAIVASMLPDGVVKGGSALKMRFGEENTRFTTDLDTATATDPAAYAAQLDSRLRTGWEGFSGRVVKKGPGLARWGSRAVRHAAVRRQAGLPREALVHGAARGRP